MAQITLQIHHAGVWHDAAIVGIDSAQAGIGSVATLDYDMDYWMAHASIDSLDGKIVRDFRAASVTLPVDIATARSDRWHSFLVDLIPQGTMRRKLAADRKWGNEDPRLDFELLMLGGGSPIGNLRIKEAWEDDVARHVTGDFAGVTEKDMLALTDAFLDVWERAGLSAAGSEGVQGEWPKILMTQDVDGFWFPDPIVSDSRARAHVLMKRAKGDKDDSRSVLASEPGYLEIARDFGLRVAAPISHGSGVLMIPRFDRSAKNGAIVRHGQESAVSALGVSEWGYSTTHEAYVAMLRETTSDPETEIIEYVLRDVLNMAAGNPDNHGRNTALRKLPDGSVSLTPLFDFAPMRRMTEGGRVTKWSRATTLDQEPDWVAVAEAASGDTFAPDRLLEALRTAEPFIRELPERARAAGVPEEVIEDNIVRHTMVADTLANIPDWKSQP